MLKISRSRIIYNRFHRIQCYDAWIHGILDKQDNLLVPFRTWRNTITEKASIKLTELFQYNIPQRWSIAHLYQASKQGRTCF